jgi:DNA-directed RNA polymerase subunit beta'
MVFSGARGKKEQLRQMIAAPMLMESATGKILATPVTKSYAEGLDVGDYWLTQHGARKGTLQRAQGTSDPGSMSKDLINTTMNTLIVSEDCATHSGIRMDVDHPDITDRFLAQEIKLKDGTKFKAGSQLSPEILTRLKNNREKSVVVRTPLKCAHGEGICAKCYGLNEKGHLHDVGTNIGILSGQAMGEPAVQMAMDAFHTGGLATGRGGASVSRLERLKQIIKLPKTLRGEATVAYASGTIANIKPDPVGGHDVFIDGIRHYVSQINPKLRVGDAVKKGDSLSHPEAIINPRHVLDATKDIHAVQNLLTQQLHSPATKDPNQTVAPGLYEREGVRRRNIEVAVRAMTNLTRIKDPGDSHWDMGDVAPHAIIEEWNRNRDKTEKAIVHEPELRGSGQMSEASRDWMARLNYQRLHDTVQAAAAQSWKSDIHGSNPIPGYAQGAEFGKPPAGKPKHNY